MVAVPEVELAAVPASCPVDDVALVELSFAWLFWALESTAAVLQSTKWHRVHIARPVEETLSSTAQQRHTR